MVLCMLFTEGKNAMTIYTESMLKTTLMFFLFQATPNKD